VSALGVWLAASQLHAFALNTFLLDARSNGVALLCTVASVAACWLAQASAPYRRPAVEDTVRR
jgi:hypothetical protein